jgi:nitroreductase
VVDDKDLLPEVFAALEWAGYIAPKGDPPEGEKPTAYVVVLVTKRTNGSGYERDVGAAVENILLASLEEGIGSCWIGSINKKRFRKILHIPHFLAIDSVIALGYSGESPVMEEMTDSIKYWKDESGTLHVPKRELKNILHRNKY